MMEIESVNTPFGIVGSHTCISLSHSLYRRITGRMPSNFKVEMDLGRTLGDRELGFSIIDKNKVKKKYQKIENWFSPFMA